MADTVEQAVYSLSYDTGDSASKVTELTNSSSALADSADRVETSTQKVTAATRDSQGAYERLMGSLDPAIRAHNQLEAVIERTQGMFDRGAISAEQYAAAIAAAHSKFDDAAAGGSKLADAFHGVTSALGALGVAYSAGAIIHFAEETLHSVAALDQQAKVAGVSTDALQAYRAAAVLSGAEQETADAAIRRFTRSLGDAAEMAHGPARQAFTDLHLGAADLAGGAEASLPKVANALLSITDASERARDEVALFGKSGQEVEAFLKAWADPNIVNAMKEDGYVLDHELIERAHQFEMQWAASWMYWKDQGIVAIGELANEMAKYPWLGVAGGAAAGAAVGGVAGSFIPGVGTLFGAGIGGILGAVGSSFKAFGGNPIPDQLAITPNLSAGNSTYSWIDDAKKAVEDNPIAQFWLDAQKAEDQYDQKTAEAQQALTDEIAAKWNAYYQKQAEDIQKVLDQIDEMMKPRYDPTRGYVDWWNTKNPVTDEAAKLAQQNADEQAAAEKKAADESQQYWDRMFQTAFTGGENAFTKMLEGNRVKLSSFLDDFEKMFGTMLADLAMKAVAEPILMPILAGAASSLGLGPAAVGGPMGMTTALAGAMGGSSGMAGLFGSTADPMAASYGGYGTVGTFFNTPLYGTGGLFDTGGAPSDASLSSILGPAAAGAGIGSLMGNLTGGSQVGSTVGGALGSALGNALGGPIGGFIGSLAGSALGGLIGQKNAPGAYAHFGDNQLSDIAYGQASSQTSSATQAAANAISSAAQQLQAAGVTLTNSITQLAERPGKQTQITTSTGQILQGGDLGNTQMATDTALNYILQGASSTDAITQKIISAYEDAGKLQGQFAESLISDITTVHNILNSVANPQQQTQTELELKNINTQFDAAIAKLQTLGVDTTTLVTAQQTAVDAILSNYNKAIYDAVGNVADTALTGWSNLIYDETTKLQEAQQIGADVAALQEQNFTDQLSYLEKLSDAQRNALEEQLSLAGSLQATLAGALSTAQSSVAGQLSTAQQFASAMQSAAQSYATAANSLQTNAESLLLGNLSPLSPAAQYQAAQQIFQSTYASAQNGNLTAINDLSNAGNQFLQASRSYNATGTGYATDFDTVEKALQSVAGVAMNQSKSAADQATLAQEQVSVLTDIQTNLKQALPDQNLLKAQLALLQTISDASTALVRANPLGFEELASTITGSGAVTTQQLAQINLQTLAAESLLGALNTTLAHGLTLANAPTVLNELQQLQGALLGAGLSGSSPIASAINTLTAAATSGLQNAATAANVTSALDLLNHSIVSTVANANQENAASVTGAMAVLNSNLAGAILTTGASNLSALSAIGTGITTAQGDLSALNVTLAGGLTVANAPTVVQELNQMKSDLLAQGLSSGSPIFSAINTLLGVAQTGNVSSAASAAQVSASLEFLNQSLTTAVSGSSNALQDTIASGVSVLDAPTVVTSLDQVDALLTVANANSAAVIDKLTQIASGITVLVGNTTPSAAAAVAATTSATSYASQIPGLTGPITTAAQQIEASLFGKGKANDVATQTGYAISDITAALSGSTIDIAKLNASITALNTIVTGAPPWLAAGKDITASIAQLTTTIQQLQRMLTINIPAAA